AGRPLPTQRSGGCRPTHFLDPRPRGGRAPGASAAVSPRRARALELGDRVGRVAVALRGSDSGHAGFQGNAGVRHVVTSPDPAIIVQRAVLVLPTTAEFDSRTYRIASALAARGHEVTVLARWRPGLPQDET